MRLREAQCRWGMVKVFRQHIDPDLTNKITKKKQNILVV